MKTQKKVVITLMFKTLNILGICLILVALFAPTAHAETVFVDPGPVDGQANNFSFVNAADPAALVDLVWTDNKTLEWGSGTQGFFLFGPPCVGYAGILLDAAGNAIPDTELAGRTQCTAGSDLSLGVIDLPAATVFSGIRLFSGAFNSSNGWQWNWDPNERPTIGQTEASGNQPPVPDAGGPYEGVAGQPVTFDASGSSDPDGTIDEYAWDFGDETKVFFGVPTVQHTYASAGKYHVILTVTDDDGVSKSTSTIANIGNISLRPTADANGPYTGETGVNVTFDGTGSADDGTIDQYAWDFGDDSPVINAPATTSHRYGAVGTYYVVLTVTDNHGNTDSTVTTATIAAGNQAPVADAGPPAEGVVGTPVYFDGSNSSDADGDIATYTWDFGDSSPIDTASGANPSHTYATPGDYTVRLTVTDGDGVPDSDSTVASIDVNPLSPRADAGPPAAGTTGVAVSFDGSGSDDPDGNIVTYAWDFGDSSPIDDVSGVNPSHSYSVAGSYTVTLTVTDDDGLTGTDTTQAAIDQANSPPTSYAGGPYKGTVDAPVLFDASGSSDPDGSIVQYDWDFDDGGTGSGLYVEHTYTAPGTYTATLTVTDDDGDTDQSNATVNIAEGNQPPVPDAGGPYEGVADQPVTFDASGSSDPDGTIAGHNWEFGDTTTRGGEIIQHTYASSGKYHVILTVTDDMDVSKSDNTIADIGNFSLRPTADANGPYNGRVGVQVKFDGTGSTDPDPDGTIDEYAWDFGDDTPVVMGTATPQHAYAAADTYYVKLTVTDNTGNTDVDVTTVQVGIGNVPPLADAGDSISGKGLRITFDGTRSSDPDGNIVSYDWTFGDGGTGTGPTPTHTYAAPGAYFVILTVTDNDGATDSDVTLAVISQLDEIIGTWDSGIWYWDVAESSWTQMTSSVTDGDIAAGDFTGDGIADVASIYASGLWYKDGDSLAWTKVTSSAPDNVTAGDVTGDGRAEIIGTWDSGIWYWDVVESKWTQMTKSVTTGDIAAGDFTGDGFSDVASIWPSGLWYQDGATLAWTEIPVDTSDGPSGVPNRLTAGNITEN